VRGRNARVYWNTEFVEMTDRQWLADAGLAVLLVLPTAALMWPSPSASPSQTSPAAHEVATATTTAHSQVEQRFGLRR
jgi:hypothetical protein